MLHPCPRWSTRSTRYRRRHACIEGRNSRMLPTEPCSITTGGPTPPFSTPFRSVPSCWTLTTISPHPAVDAHNYRASLHKRPKKSWFSSPPGSTHGARCLSEGAHGQRTPLLPLPEWSGTSPGECRGRRPFFPLGPRNPSTGGHFPFRTFTEPCTVRMSSHHHGERPFPGRCRGRAVPVGRREENGQPKSTSLHR